ncbi:MAG: OmpW family outer membrane protein [Fluviicoccus sp.]|uniref:OmpW/AlkL family protein n=1 Tax=Fluviicoccus sp. TaxID=2003552 RepID=UPI002725EE75|nr:OmpW family outer membrane protein [Fluviicoccus sp.]MDO8330387.1 OmpW family outer membrane protein [Fluviicoccus sp.]
MRALPLMLAMGLVAGFSGVAAAGESPWTVKVGASQIKPKNSDVIAGFDMNVSKELGLTPSIEYKFSPNLVGEVLLAIPFEHDVEVPGAGKVASFKHLPPTFTAKYLFSPEATFSPYVGIGLNYTLVFGEELTATGKAATASNKLTGSDSIGLAATAGLEYRLPNSPWGVALDVRYIKISSDLKLDGNKIGTLKVDPLVVGLSAAYHY